MQSSNGVPMLSVLGLDHVVYRTTRMPEMLAFYRDLLGCPIERELEPDVGLVQLRAGNALIDLVPVDSQLGRAGGLPPDQLKGRQVDHVCLQIEPVDEAALSEWLKSNNVQATEWAERYGATGFGRSLYVNDPEGNIVELKVVQTPR